mgnify:CR=1 FL=1
MAAKKSSPLKIIPLGGLDGIGKNMTVFECGDDMVLVDAGLMFPDDSQPGIDLVLPDYTYVLENEEKLRGIVVTHGHEDHTGSLPYLLQDLNNKVPIFSSKLTLGFIEGKLSEFRIRAPKFREVKGGSHVNLGGISLDFFSMTHSIPGALGVFIRTNQGTVMHTGDFKLDQTASRPTMPLSAALPSRVSTCCFPTPPTPRFPALPSPRPRLVPTCCTPSRTRRVACSLRRSRATSIVCSRSAMPPASAAVRSL